MSRRDKVTEVARTAVITGASAASGLLAGIQGVDLLVGAGLGLAIPRVWDRRLRRFVELLNERVGELEDRWDDTVATAIALGLRSAFTADDEKLEYLANAVANAATSDEWRHDTASILLRLVGDLTATHLRVLDLLADPEAWVHRTGVLLDPLPAEDGFRFDDAIAQAFAAAGSSIDDVALILGDLEALGMLNIIGASDESPSDRPPEFVPENVSTLGHRVHRFVTWRGTS